MQARIAGVQRLDLGEVVEVDEITAVHAQEARRVQPRLDAGHRAAQRVIASQHVQVHVIARGLQPFDLAGVDQELLAQLAHQEPLRPVHRLHRRPLVRLGQQRRLALLAQQPQPRQADQRDDEEIAADVLQVLVAEVRPPGTETVVPAHRLVSQLAQPDHAGHVQQAECQTGQQVPGQAVAPGIEAERPAPLHRPDEGDQQQDQQRAARFPHPRFPGRRACVVDLRNETVEHRVEDGQRHPEGHLDRAGPTLEVPVSAIRLLVHAGDSTWPRRNPHAPVPHPGRFVPDSPRSVPLHWERRRRRSTLAAVHPLRSDTMKRRDLLKAAVTLPLLPLLMRNGTALARGTGALTTALRSRLRPGQPGWPAAAEWAQLKRQVGGRLLKLESPFAHCDASPPGGACAQALKQLDNPFAVGDNPALTQTSGWADAWTSQPSAYAVAAEHAADVVAAVNFARKHHLRLVVKGGGHSYQGTSDAPDSLLVWTRHMNQVNLHDAFVPQGCAGHVAPQPAVSVQAGAMWIDAYDAVTTRGGRYVQGGGCTTVGVAGLVQSGGFGSLSKRWGTAASNLLEAEVVTADGQIRIANACTNPELFWGLKGGGGGSLGVVTRLTLRTFELPEFFGGVGVIIKAESDTAYRALIAAAVDFYQRALFNPHWGEQMKFYGGDTLDISMMFQDLTQQQAEQTWAPFLDWVKARKDCRITKPFQALA